MTQTIQQDIEDFFLALAVQWDRFVRPISPWLETGKLREIEEAKKPPVVKPREPSPAPPSYQETVQYSKLKIEEIEIVQWEKGTYDTPVAKGLEFAVKAPPLGKKCNWRVTMRNAGTAKASSRIRVTMISETDKPCNVDKTNVGWTDLKPDGIRKIDVTMTYPTKKNQPIEYRIAVEKRYGTGLKQIGIDDSYKVTCTWQEIVSQKEASPSDINADFYEREDDRIPVTLWQGRKV